MIGARLKEERNRLKLTQPEFAAAAGAAKRTLIEWEKGETSPSAVQLSALRDIGVDVFYVLTGERDRQPETQDAFIDRMRAINLLGQVVDALPLPEAEREGIKLCLTGDPTQDAKAISEAAHYGPPPEPTVVTTGDRATVIRIAEPPLRPATPPPSWLDVLALVIDELNASGRRLSGAKVISLVDLLLQLQQNGARLEPSVLRSQLRLIA